MCTVLLAWRCVDGADFVLAANRDELLARHGTEPELLSSLPPIAGGRDLTARGTWLAVAPDARVCAVTNRRAGSDEVARDPSRRSRGEIPVDLLMQPEADIAGHLRDLGPGRYNPVNVLYVSPAVAIAASVDDTAPPRVTVLEPGVHILTVGDIDDGTRDKDAALYAHVMRTMNQATSAQEMELRMRVVLSRHDSPSGDPLDAACIHGDVYGTVSAATVIAADGATTYRHAQGRPCTTPFGIVGVLESAV
ncbi:MAG TPA: NRDE family protein [Candidatus Dormibacteraeota bacterium]